MNHVVRTSFLYHQPHGGARNKGIESHCLEALGTVFLQLNVSGPECSEVKASSIWHFLAARSSHGEAFVYLKKFPLCLAQPICHGWVPLSPLLLTWSRISVHPVLLPQCIYSFTLYASYNEGRLLCAAFQNHVYVRVCILPPGLWICRKGFCGGGSALGGPNSSSNVS